LIVPMKGGMFVPKKLLATATAEDLRLNDPSLETFREYLANSNITRLTSGAYGITYIVELQDSNAVRQPFLNLTVGKSYKSPAKKLLVKICTIDDPRVEEKTWEVSEKMGIRPSKLTDINTEINIQTDVYLKTMHYLQPLCPGIVFTAVTLRGKTAETGVLRYFPDIPQNGSGTSLDDAYNNSVFFGIIVMELASHYKTMHKIDNDDRFTKHDKALTKLKCFYALISLALETGYAHGDHHFANIMFNTNDHSYFFESPGRPLLIDFGRSSKIPPVEMKKFRSLCESGQYLDAIVLLCVEPTANPFVADTRFKSFYGWACLTYGKMPMPKSSLAINDDIRKIFEMREKQMNLNVEIMEKLHKKSDVYPLLPLSNAIKNELYNGILPADKPKTKTIKVTMRSQKTKTRRTRTKHSSKRSSHSKSA